MRTQNQTKTTTRRLNTFILMGILLLAGAVAVPLASVSSSSRPKALQSSAPYQAPQAAGDVHAVWRSTDRAPLWLTGAPSSSMAQPATETIATYASDCTTPQSVFQVGDTVCVQVTGVPLNAFFPRRVTWECPDASIPQSSPITSDPQTGFLQITSTFTVGNAVSDSRGTWHVVVRNPFFFYPEARAAFTVSDQANPEADIAVATTFTSNSAQIGSNAIFGLQVTNYGPDSSANVQLTDALPAGTSFVSFSQSNGPAFACNTVSGTTTCTIASLASGAVATFVANFQIDSGTSVDNTASLSADTSDINSLNNTTTASLGITSGGGGGGTCDLTCPEDVTVNADTTENDQRGAHVTFPDTVAAGDCGSVTTTPASGSFFPVGTTIVTSTSETGGGSCSFTVTVNDTGSNPPTISCPPNPPAANADNDCEAVVNIGAPTATGDNVIVVGVRSDGKPLYNCDCFPNSPNQQEDSCNIYGGCSRKNPDLPFSAGTTTIVWQAISHDTPGPYQTPEEEEAHRTGTVSCTETIVVNDVTPPVIGATNSSASADENCQAPVPDYSSTASDNCACSSSDQSEECQGHPHFTYTQTPAAGTLVGMGPHTVHIEVNDNSSNNNGAGNTTTKDVTFTVNDTTAPTISCPANIVRNTDPGICSAVVDPGTATATDNCDNSVTIAGTRSDSQPLNASYPKGTTTIHWTATDDAGNSSSCNQTVTVEDHEAPTISCPANIVLEPTCASGAVATYTAPVGQDNCPGATTTRTAGGASGTVFPIGTTTVTYSVTDAAGNGPVSCSFTVTVKTVNQTILDMEAYVNSLPLSGTQKQGLNAKLEAARTAPNNNVACNKLNDFISQVQAFINNGTLTSAQGTPLITSAQHLRNTLGCTNNPCT